MNMRNVIFVTFILASIKAYSNVYNCSSPTAKPESSYQSIKSELNISYYAPHVNSSESNKANLQNKIPYLIYYAIDSSEDFMKYSVQFEVAKLEEACSKNANVQFVAFLNSMYVQNNSFIICKDRKVSIIDLKQFPKLDLQLKSKRQYFSKKHYNYEYGPLDYLVDLKENNKSFWNFPLAHPDFVFDLIKLATTNTNIFPNSKYAAFLNLKSHGSKAYVLAGMHQCQEKAKQLESKAIVQRLISKSEIKFLKSLNSIESVKKNISKFEKIITKLDLGVNHGNGSFVEDRRLGENRLGENRLSVAKDSFGSSISGLGVSQGLGVNQSFGTDQANLGWILRDLFRDGTNKSLAFLMLESCETNRDPYAYHKYINNVFAYYTARKSLWYRNLNWWEILEKANGKTFNMIKILEDETLKIQNIEVVPSK